MSLDRAVEAAAEALTLNGYPYNNKVARITVEAAAPHLYADAQASTMPLLLSQKDRAERAEAMLEQTTKMFTSGIDYWKRRAEQAEEQVYERTEQRNEAIERAERAEEEVARLKLFLGTAQGQAMEELRGRAKQAEAALHESGRVPIWMTQELVKRAERAEAHVRQLLEDMNEWQNKHVNETILADELAEVLLHADLHYEDEQVANDALAKWEEARRET